MYLGDGCVSGAGNSFQLVIVGGVASDQRRAAGLLRSGEVVS
jgi:hypothetical protein